MREQGETAMESEQLYRKKSVEQIQSPEQLNGYLRVTNPGVWIVLTAVILLLAGLLVWGSFIYIDSVAYGHAEVSDGVMTIRFDDERAAEHLETGMTVTAGEMTASILSVGRDEEGIFALAPTSLADGEYEVSVQYKQTQILRLLFN